MNMRRPDLALLGALTLGISACQTTNTSNIGSTTPKPSGCSATPHKSNTTPKADRDAILSMAGNYAVTFDFQETVTFQENYTPKERKISKAHEIVRVIQNCNDFISLQHILVVGDENDKFPIKHWRQDWRYQPDSVLTFVGGNAWELKKLPPAQRKHNWSQTVYQVDDSPRYGGVGTWTHSTGVSQWTALPSWRPLPRRDMTTRDDYHVVRAVNRHALTPDGWVHEQDNTKLVLLNGQSQALVREIGVNTYRRDQNLAAEIADSYWQDTRSFWSAVRSEWSRIEATGKFAITLKGETADLYGPIMDLARDVQSGDMSVSDAVEEARTIMAEYTTDTPDPLTERLRTTSTTIQ